MKNKLYRELKTELAESDAKQRKYWAKKIVDHNIKIEGLISLLKEDYKIATRFSWLLSDIGEYDSVFLHSNLDILFKLRKEVKTFNFESKFIKYWILCGIPSKQEAFALDLLFDNLISDKTNVSTKSYIIKLLFSLSKKYPDIKPELVVCLENELQRNSKTFQKKAANILQKL